MLIPIVSDCGSIRSVFAYRAFDLRNRFPQPLETFRQALECLQSGDAYMPEESGDIVAYLRGGGALHIPEYFFIRQHEGCSAALVSPQENDDVCDLVEEWLKEALLLPEADVQDAATVRAGRFDL